MCIWKPSSKVPLCAVACQNIIASVLKITNNVPEGVGCVLVGNHVGDRMNNDKRVPLVSFTGSTRVGRIVSSAVAQRFGKSILELGGNNAIIVSEHSDLNMVLVGTVFGAVGTAGQRCTSTRRLIVHEKRIRQDRQRTPESLRAIAHRQSARREQPCRTAHRQGAVDAYLKAIEKAKQEGGKMIVEGGVLSGDGYESGCYVKPCIVEAKNSFHIVQEETFAPILYLLKYKTIDEAIAMQNDVPQGLSSAIFTNEHAEMEQFLSHEGSDCGIANVNIGTSGAEIGGRSVARKKPAVVANPAPMPGRRTCADRPTRSTTPTNLPLAQGIKFDI